VPRYQPGRDNWGVQELPAGTVTMLFSDIEGSTVLLSRLGDLYGEALSSHRAIMRAAISGRRGLEMGTDGDSFFVVFASAADAVACCVAAQRALGGYDLPGGAAVRVRMGLHSGEPARHEDGYIGMDVHRAARIAATAHGGQVVMSAVTWRLARSGLPAELSVRDLGFHRLKDIEEPERIFQLAGPGLQEEFPRLKSLGASASLPAPATPLVGRESDLDHLRAVIFRPGVRLATLTGTGGVGKTRLALAAAASLESAFPQGVFFVALATVRDAAVMWKAIAGDLDVDGDAPAAVMEHLRERQALLVLDNLEQLHGAAEVVATLLAAAPRLVVLATSRRPLHLQGEHELPVPPLDVPRGPTVGEVAASGAALLFVQQADMVRPGFAATAANAADIAAICRRLDGLPLAIELAASRVKLLSTRALLARLGHSLALAGADAGRPSRQQTVRATIAWSYDLLAPRSAAVLRRAGVFAGGCDLDALATVALPVGDPLEAAGELADVSLVTVTEGPDGEPRFGMLETIREYALERLAEAGELEDTRRRHAGHYAALAEGARDQLVGPAQFVVLGRLEADYDNLRAALTWSLGSSAAGLAADRERVAIGLRLAQALGLFWNIRGHAGEGRRWLQRAVDAAGDDDAGAPLASVAHWLGMLLIQHGELDAAVRLFERSLAIWRDLDERDEQARELNSLGGTHRRRGDLDAARSALNQCVAICREVGNEGRLGGALTNLGQTELYARNFDPAMELLQEALALHRRHEDSMGAAVDLISLAFIGVLTGRAREARGLLSGTLDYLASSGDSEATADVLEVAACIAAELGEGPRAARLAGAASALRELVSMPVSQEDADVIEGYLSRVRAATAPGEWEAEQAAGRALTQEQAIALLASAMPRPPPSL
jgi:predicted ATPase/class 3 adenylate cyclase